MGDLHREGVARTRRGWSAVWRRPSLQGVKRARVRVKGLGLRG